MRVAPGLRVVAAWKRSGVNDKSVAIMPCYVSLALTPFKAQWYRTRLPDTDFPTTAH